MTAVTVERVNEALQDVLDPCSVGRGVPAGLVDMGMIKTVGLGRAAEGGSVVTVEIRITSPACTFQPYFEREVRKCLAGLDEVDEVRIEWDQEFDWTDDDMSPALKQRLREKRHRLLKIASTSSGPSSAAE